MIKIQLTLLLCLAFFISQAQDLSIFKTPGNYDQYVPVLFEFNNRPFSIARPAVHEDRRWLTYGIATINGIGFAWGSGNSKIKLENFNAGFDEKGNGFANSFVGKVIVEWKGSGIIVYLRGNSTYRTTGNVVRNDGTYTADVGTIRNLDPVSIDERGFNVPPGVYVADWEINADTKSIDSSTGNNLLFFKNDNVGIGTSNPQSKLDVAGGINVPNGFPIQLSGNDSSHGLKYKRNINENALLDGPFLYGFYGGSLGLRRWEKETHVLNWNESGNVGIGVADPHNKLDVNGTIHAKEVKIDMNGWADYVFKKDYKLPTLSQVENHIKEKGHLPNVPNEREVLEKGLSLGENQKILLQKIEELTLYIIEQNKNIIEQNKINQEQALELKNLKQEINQLKK